MAGGTRIKSWSRLQAMVFVICAAIATQGGIPTAAAAKAGGLDSSLGKDGTVTTAMAPGAAQIHVSIAPDDGIVVAYGERLVRYLPDGRLDKSFGERGTVTIGDVEGLRFALSDVAVDRDGRVVVFGTSVDTGIHLYPPSVSSEALSPSFATILRYGPKGELDPSFGDGDGIVRSDLGAPPSTPLDAPFLSVTTGAIDAQGRLVVVAGVMKSFSPCAGHSYYRRSDRLIARLTPMGELDPSFGGGDGATLFEGIDEVEMALGTTGESVLIGSHDSHCDKAGVTLMRIGVDGVPDQVFGGTDGTVVYKRDGIQLGVALDSSGRTLALGASTPQTNHALGPSSLLRLTPNGKPDHSFGHSGKTLVRLLHRPSWLSSLTVDPQGRPLLVGAITLPEHKPEGDLGPPRGCFTVIRLTASGKKDRHFGRAGGIATRFGRGVGAVPKDAVIDTKGRLVVVGLANGPRLGSAGGVALARYRLGR